MKQIFLTVVLLATAFVQNVFAQDSTQKVQLSQLLHSYYDIKNALVSGNTANAAKYAGEFEKNLDTIDAKLVSAGYSKNLIKNATGISEGKNVDDQRSHFVELSQNMIALVKVVKLSPEPIYLDYCPMKKAWWLSSSTTIKNPYYGNAMLTCGSIKDTL